MPPSSMVTPLMTSVVDGNVVEFSGGLWTETSRQTLQSHRNYIAHC